MDAVQAIEVRRVKLSEDLTAPGDYVFIAKREPKVTVEKTPLLPPEDNGGTNTMFLLRLLWWKLFGAKYELKQIVEMRWPEYDAVIVNCPACNSPCATTKRHKIVAVEPLTLEMQVTCPYCKTVSFDIKDGKLITA